MTTAVNSTVFPLAGNVMCPARGSRSGLRVYNPAANAAVTITYPSGFVLVLQPGQSLQELTRCPQGIFLVTGTAGQTLNWEEEYV